MKYLTGNEIRSMWLEFFKEHGHSVEESASLIPSDDKSLLWMNAGVTPLKKYFDGRKIPKNPRICNAQKCIRTNDIENVGKTSRHHTFFEMLGNFSIGDYFRDEVIPWAFELLTSEKWFAIPKEKLYITYYPDDKDTLNKWIEVGMLKDHMIPCKGNFWEIGEGPCGPDTEIFFDRGEKYGNFTKQAIEDDIENDRYIEMWNIVFSQFNSDGSGNRASYKQLPKKNIDTGAGLERLACIFQDVETNFDTDLFRPMIKKIEELSGRSYHGEEDFKIIADHIRTIVFALSDGALFSNEGRGYVLRRLLRRGVKHGLSLGIKEPFMYKLVDEVTELMSGYYPGLKDTRDLEIKLIKREEEKFFNTLDSGIQKLEEVMNQSKDKIISGHDAFLLFDTYGFPVELTLEYAEEKGLKVDVDGFHEEMNKQKERARSAQNNGSAFRKQNAEYLAYKDKVEFVGYEELSTKAKVVKVFEEGIVCDKTPFYAICGGQVGDTGSVTKGRHQYAVVDTLMLPNKQHLMVVENPELFNVGDEVFLEVDQERREKLTKNHSACHLMFKALRDILGTHVSQQGSEISPEALRFDFNHFESLTDEDILKVEALTNDFINRGYKRVTKVMTPDEAIKVGAVAEFGEKYGDEVRVVDLGATVDVCGGTHVNNTKDIEKFMALPVSSIGSGIYRITGLAASGIDKEKEFLKNYFNDIEKLMNKAKGLENLALSHNINNKFEFDTNIDLTGSYQDVINIRRLTNELHESLKTYEKTINKLIDEKSLSSYDIYLESIKDDNCVLLLDEFDKGKIRNLIDYISDHINGVVGIINKSGGRLQVLVKSKNDKDASKILKDVLSAVGGAGGGKKEFAQGGAPDASLADKALSLMEESIR